MEQTARTIKTLRRFHRVVGPLAPCSWAAYSNTLVNLYKADRETLEALKRIGTLMVDANGVRFAL